MLFGLTLSFLGTEGRLRVLHLRWRLSLAQLGSHARSLAKLLMWVWAAERSAINKSRLFRHNWFETLLESVRSDWGTPIES